MGTSVATKNSSRCSHLSFSTFFQFVLEKKIDLVQAKEAFVAQYAAKAIYTNIESNIKQETVRTTVLFEVCTMMALI